MLSYLKTCGAVACLSLLTGATTIMVGLLTGVVFVGVVAGLVVLGKGLVAIEAHMSEA